MWPATNCAKLTQAVTGGLTVDHDCRESMFILTELLHFTPHFCENAGKGMVK